MIFNRNQGDFSEIDDSTPLYNSRIMSTYLQYIRNYYPGADIDSILQYAGMTQYEVDDPGHWFSQQQADRLHEILVIKTGNPDIARDAGRFTVSSDRLGALKQFTLGLVNISSIYLMIGKLANNMTRSCEFRTKKIAANKAEIISTPKAGVREKAYQCENRMGTLESVPKLFTDAFATIEHPSCFHAGAECCRYIVTWPQTTSLRWRHVLRCSLIFGLSIIILSFCLLPYPLATTVSFCSILGWLMVWLQAERSEKKELIQTIETQGNAASALLDEINSRHRNALLIQEFGQTVSGLLEIDKINQAVLENLRKHSDYDFGAVFLANEKKTDLRCVAEFNREDSRINLATNGTGNPIRLNAAGTLAESFKKMKPLLRNAAAEIETDLSEIFLAHLHWIDAGSIICVPIAYKEDALGILAVSNAKSKKPLTQSDISLLMGVASHTATNIMNAVTFERVKQSEARYRILANNITDVIWILDIATLKFSYASPSIERMQGYTPAELRQLPLQSILTPESFRLAADTIAEELLKEKNGSFDPSRSRTVELEEYCKDGTLIWVEVTASFLRNDRGQPISILGVTRNISERKLAEKEKEKLEAQLQRSQKMETLGTLAGGVAHDLNNILSGVVSYPELLLLDLPQNSPLRKPIETIHESGKKAAAIVEDLLTLARRGVAISEVIDLNDIITKYLSSPEFEKLKSFHPLVNVNTTLEPVLLNIKGSAVHLFKTIMNLVSNAAEAMPDGGLITIATQNQYIDKPVRCYDEIQEGDYAVLEITDAGIGIPSEDVSRIFEPFYSKKVMGRSGTGLGMTVVWGTVKDHNGYIDLESAQGRGTKITLYFPVTHEMRCNKKAPFSMQDHRGNGESILVVDDVKEQRQIISAILSQLGYAAKTVSCGEAAVEYIKNNKADLIILDMIMDPGMDGLETYKEILKIQPNQKALIVSGFAETDRVREAQQWGAGDYIKKPYTIEKISLAIQSALDRGNDTLHDSIQNQGTAWRVGPQEFKRTRETLP